MNPYRPGAGMMPEKLAGRELHRDWWGRQLSTTRSFGHPAARHRAIHGLRGIGKTILLRTFREEAQHAGFVAISIEASRDESLRDSLLKRVQRPDPTTAKHPAWRDTLARISSFNIGVAGVELGASVERQPAMDAHEFQAMLRDVAEAIHDKHKTGLAILIDEAQQAAPRDLKAISGAIHQLNQDGHPPLCLVLTGLPDLPRALVEADSYAVRLYEHYELGHLTRDESMEALIAPALGHGVRWQPDAANAVADYCQGYPAFIQEYGAVIWDHALGTDATITIADVQAGATAAQHSIQQGYYATTWHNATPAERPYLAAIAQTGGTRRAAEIAAELGRSPQSLTRLREQLIAAGDIYPSGPGEVSLAVPGLAQYINAETALEQGTTPPAQTNQLAGGATKAGSRSAEPRR